MNVHIAVVRPDLEKDVLRPVPLVQQFFHEVILTTQPETNRTLVPFVARVADHLDLHLDPLPSQRPTTSPVLNPSTTIRGRSPRVCCCAPTTHTVKPSKSTRFIL